MIQHVVPREMIVEAQQVTEGNIRSIADWVIEAGHDARIETVGAIVDAVHRLVISTETDTTRLDPGDWVLIYPTNALATCNNEDYKNFFEPAVPE